MFVYSTVAACSLAGWCLLGVGLYSLLLAHIIVEACCGVAEVYEYTGPWTPIINFVHAIHNARSKICTF